MSRSITPRHAPSCSPRQALPRCGRRIRSSKLSSCTARVRSGVRAIVDALRGVRRRGDPDEGGPQLLGRLIAARAVHELFLTVSPRIAGRDHDHPRPGWSRGGRPAPTRRAPPPRFGRRSATTCSCATASKPDAGEPCGPRRRAGARPPRRSPLAPRHCELEQLRVGAEEPGCGVDDGGFWGMAAYPHVRDTCLSLVLGLLGRGGFGARRGAGRSCGGRRGGSFAPPRCVRRRRPGSPATSPRGAGTPDRGGRDGRRRPRLQPRPTGPGPRPSRAASSRPVSVSSKTRRPPSASTARTSPSSSSCCRVG